MSEYERTEVIERGDEPGGPPPPWRESLWIPLALVGLVAVGLILWLAFGRGGDEEAARATVPDVVGLTEDEARGRIDHAGLEARFESAPNDAEAGIAIAQAPGAGTQLAEGEVVRVTLSAGTTEPPATETETETQTETVTETEQEEVRTATVPDVEALTLGDAAEIFFELNLLPQTYPVESTERRGTVVAQSPEPGAVVEVELVTTIRLDVALGAGARESREVPQMTNANAAEALVRCYREGLTCRFVFRDSDDAERGTVLGQEPAPGTTVEVLQQVTLAIAR